MSLNSIRDARWEVEFLKCHTKKEYVKYIAKYENELSNPYIQKARARLEKLGYFECPKRKINKIKIVKSYSSKADKNWREETRSLLGFVTPYALGILLAIILRTGYNHIRESRNAEANRALMESLLRRFEARDKMIQAWNEQMQERIDNIRNADNTLSTHNHYNSNVNQRQNDIFVPIGIDYNEIMTEYNSEVASRQTPQEFLNERVGSMCKSCNGTKKCPACNGTKIASSFGNTYVCKVCNETGICPACEGTGLTSWNR